MRKLAIKTRADKIETEHYGYLALTDSSGTLDKTLNDDKSFYVRSCIKPIQAKLCKEILGDELNDQFLVMSIASHLSTEAQITILQDMLKTFNLDEELLYCGTKSSTNTQRFKSKLYHNCAGKHIAHLAASKKVGLSEDYYSKGHQIQKRIYQELLTLSKKDALEMAVDGCGLPTFYMSLPDLASSFSHASHIDTYKDIFKIVNQYANLISAPGRFDQELMLQFPNQFFAKSGADGMMLITRLESNETLVIKILDGEKRVKDIVSKKILEDLNWIKKDSLSLDHSVYNSLGQATSELVGLDSL